MTPETVITLGQQALTLTTLLAAPLLLAALVVGLVVGMVQAATQINEMTLSFIPKIVASVAALLIFGPWMLEKLLAFTAALLESLPSYAR
jgi:flagellar biosynthetic protein FliQ